MQQRLELIRVSRHGQPRKQVAQGEWRLAPTARLRVILVVAVGAGGERQGSSGTTGDVRFVICVVIRLLIDFLTE